LKDFNEGFFRIPWGYEIEKVTVVGAKRFSSKTRHTEGNATKRITYVRIPIDFFIPNSLYTATKLEDKIL